MCASLDNGGNSRGRKDRERERWAEAVESSTKKHSKNERKGAGDEEEFAKCTDRQNVEQVYKPSSSTGTITQN